MAPYDVNLSWTEVRDIFRVWREEKERKSREIIDMWLLTLKPMAHKLGDELLEQVYLAALDCHKMDVADSCLTILGREFPQSLRVRRLLAMRCEVLGDEQMALNHLEYILNEDKTNVAARKRIIAMYKSRGNTAKAISELNEYLKSFMSDQEGWQELCDLYLLHQEFSRAAFCMEELLLNSPHNHLYHQRFAEIKYTQGGIENMELAKAHFCQAAKLNPNNVRALFGVLQSANNLAQNAKVPSKKKEYIKLAAWASKHIQECYQGASENPIAAIEAMFGQMQLSSPA
ncbi:ER membrane protein complex subunit 2-like isoform X2 [Neocloeon triangulifer]|uniref:ER membrane protein complex subunit 2-like isoform X2 n=1 Tax=Neocloeon triangulifer TaxID=2078957 RepID=UPI00286F3E7E|nr:ER membrane protein complex subunit 2-like isoform X2 [Neocloeon triangulifer]